MNYQNGTDSGFQNHGESMNQNQLIGYSDKINDPKIAEVMKKINSSGAIFTLILAVLAVLGFTIAGAMEAGDFELPSAFYMGLGFGGLLLVIALFQKLKAKKDKTWEAVIFDKTVKEPTYSERQRGHLQARYTIHFRFDNGKTKSVNYTEELFNYFRIGERVKHHAGTPEHILEKFDKSNDSVIYCVACTSRNDIALDICHRCKCPLLK